jgi:hypothetical protein
MCKCMVTLGEGEKNLRLQAIVADLNRVYRAVTRPPPFITYSLPWSANSIKLKIIEDMIC